MGQYYHIVEGNADGSRISVYDRSVDGEYTMAKLLEHSWWENPCCQNAAKLVFKKPRRLAWVGDYAKQEDFDKEFAKKRNIPENVKMPNVRRRVWGNSGKIRGFKGKGISLDGLFFVNHELKEYVNLSGYYDWVLSEGAEDVLCPISLLTAVGNGRGGGDYHGTDDENIGRWAWNLVSLEESAPKGYKEIMVFFIEKW